MLRLISLLLCASSVLAETCELPVSVSSPGIFWRKLKTYHQLLLKGWDKLGFDERIEINGVCGNGFRNLESHESEPPRYISFSCSQGTLFYSTPNSIERREVNHLEHLSCPNAATFFETSIPGCDFIGLTYGFFVEPDMPLILANLCLDLNQTLPRFVHYLAATRNLILEEQVKLNLAILNSTSSEVVLEPRNLVVEYNALHSDHGDAFPSYIYLEYQLFPLVSFAESLGSMDMFTSDLSNTITIPWWYPLYRGNWRQIEQAIAQIGKTAQYDVFTGTSHSQKSSPQCEGCDSGETFTYGRLPNLHSLPFYVWSYVMNRYPSNDEGVVIIGVNSPFFDATKHVLCADMCDTVEWLKHLDTVRKMAPLGYVFCCHPYDVKDTLENFPNFSKEMKTDVVSKYQRLWRIKPKSVET